MPFSFFKKRINNILIFLHIQPSLKFHTKDVQNKAIEE